MKFLCASRKAGVADSCGFASHFSGWLAGREAVADDHLTLSAGDVPVPRGRTNPSPAESKVVLPVKLAARTRASTMPTWRSWSIASVRMTMRSAFSADAPWAMSSSPRSP